MPSSLLLSSKPLCDIVWGNGVEWNGLVLRVSLAPCLVPCSLLFVLMHVHVYCDLCEPLCSSMCILIHVHPSVLPSLSVVGERSGVEWLGAGFCLCSCALFLAPRSLLCSEDARLRTSVDWRRLAFPLGILRSQAVSSPSICYLRCSLRRPFLRITGGSEFRSLRSKGDQEEEDK